MANYNEAALVAAAIAGRSLNEIAALAGISRSSVQRRLREPRLMAEIQRGRARQRDEAVGQLATLRSTAIAKLAALLEHGEPVVALRSAALVLTTSAKFDMILDLDLRIRALEEHVEAEASGDDVDANSDADDAAPVHTRPAADTTEEHQIPTPASSDALQPSHKQGASK